jgi:hypothetical protein
MDRVLPDIKGNAQRQRKVFSFDGKKRISIIISLDFTQDVSRENQVAKQPPGIFGDPPLPESLEPSADRAFSQSGSSV